MMMIGSSPMSAPLSVSRRRAGRRAQAIAAAVKTRSEKAQVIEKEAENNGNNIFD
jgi:hypothetical protein